MTNDTFQEIQLLFKELKVTMDFAYEMIMQEANKMSSNDKKRDKAIRVATAYKESSESIWKGFKCLEKARDIDEEEN